MTIFPAAVVALIPFGGIPGAPQYLHFTGAPSVIAVGSGLAERYHAQDHVTAMRPRYATPSVPDGVRLGIGASGVVQPLPPT